MSAGFNFRGGKGRHGRPLVELDYASGPSGPIPMITFPGAASDAEIDYVKDWLANAARDGGPGTYFPDALSRPKHHSTEEPGSPENPIVVVVQKLQALHATARRGADAMRDLAEAMRDEH